MQKQDKAYAVVRQRIADTKDGRRLQRPVEVAPRALTARTLLADEHVARDERVGVAHELLPRARTRRPAARGPRAASMVRSKSIACPLTASFTSTDASPSRASPRGTSVGHPHRVGEHHVEPHLGVPRRAPEQRRVALGQGGELREVRREGRAQRQPAVRPSSRAAARRASRASRSGWSSASAPSTLRSRTCPPSKDGATISLLDEVEELRLRDLRRARCATRWRGCR